MSRPRTPFGSSLPGRLPATMIKVLAAEMSDQQRLARGKRYHSDAAVVDIVIGHGVLTAEVQGSRPEPYVVTIEADGGDGVPGRREIWAQCTCPDDDGSGASLCKHGVAAMFALSDEVSIEPELLNRWRTSRRRGGASNVTDLPSRPPGDTPDGTADDASADDPPSAAVIDVVDLGEFGRRCATGSGEHRRERTPAIVDRPPVGHPLSRAFGGRADVGPDRDHQGRRRVVRIGRLA